MGLSLCEQKENARLLHLDEMLELNKHLVEMINQGRAEKARRMKRKLFVGTIVSFEDNAGKVVEGKVVKTMRKYARVDTGSNVWRVPMNLLTKVTS